MMCRNNYNYLCCTPCLPVIPRQNCIINVINPVPPPQPPPQPQLFLSSYIEASASSQIVETGNNVVFNTEADYLDIVGSAISIDTAGTVFTINKSGLYHVEWNLNLVSSEEPLIISIMENGIESTATSTSLLNGNVSCGALINVGANDVPYTVNLHVYSGLLSISEPLGFQGTAGSIRILRFADGAE